MIKKLYKIASIIILLILLGYVFYLSAQTASQSSGTSGSLIQWIKDTLGIAFSQSVIRTCAHFCEYAAVGFFMCNAMYALKSYLCPFLSVILAFIYAVSDEIHQIFVPGRACQLTDMTVDLCGIILGSFIFTVLVLIIKRCALLKKEKSN